MCQETTFGLDLAVDVSDVLHGNMASVVLKLPVRFTVCFVGVNVIQNILKVAFAVPSALADFIIKTKDSIPLTCGPCSFVVIHMAVEVRSKGFKLLLCRFVTFLDAVLCLFPIGYNRRDNRYHRRKPRSEHTDQGNDYRVAHDLITTHPKSISMAATTMILPQGKDAI